MKTKFIYTFERPRIYQNPTETIDIHSVKTVKTDETKNGFCFVR